MLKGCEDERGVCLQRRRPRGDGGVEVVRGGHPISALVLISAA